jgi:opacity protein-like surface antigen
MKPFLTAVLVVALFVCVGSSQAAGKFSLNVGGDVLIPVGDFGDRAGVGFGGTVRGEYMVDPMFSIGVTAGYITWSGKDITIPGLGTISGTSASGIPLRAMGKYYFMPAGKSARVYGIAEVGVFISTTSGASSTDFNYAPGLGVEFPISDNAKIDVGARWDAIATSGVSSNNVGVRVGVLFPLGN